MILTEMIEITIEINDVDHTLCARRCNESAGSGSYCFRFDATLNFNIPGYHPGGEQGYERCQDCIDKFGGME